MSNILTDLIRLDREYEQLCELAKRNFRVKSLPIVASGLSGGAGDALSLSLCRDTEGERTNDGKRAPVLVICAEEKECRTLSEQYSGFGLRTAFYMPRDLTFYNITASHEFEHERLMVLSGILSGGYDMVFTTPHTALCYTIPPSVLRERMIKIDMLTRTEPSALSERLVASGYNRVDMVEVAGQFAQRGGIVDIFSPNVEIRDSEGQLRRGSFPVRIEFFDDEIDRMGVFDAESQRMLYNITSVSFTPSREVLVGREERERIEKAIRAKLRETHDERACETLAQELGAVTGEIAEVGFADKYISLIYPQKACLLDYFDSKTLVLVRATGAVYERLKADKWHEDENIKELCEGGTIAPKYAEYSKNAAALDLFLDGNVTVHVNSLSYGLSDKRLSGLFGFRSRLPVSYSDKFNLLCEDLLGYHRGGYKTVILTENKNSALSLASMLEDTDFKTTVFDGEGTSPEKLSDKVVYIVYGKILSGYELITPRVAVLTTENEFSKSGARGGLTTKRSTRKKRNDAQAILSYAELEVGDIVVHETYGIGRYLGLEKIKIDGVSRDYISIQYAGNDKLCMPVEKLDLVSKYIGAHADDGLVKLSKMGGDAWKKATYKAKGAVREMAKDLIKLYAERMRRPGFAFDPDDNMQRDFENSFDYDETECQLDAVSDIKQDMMRPTPMDRLLCGDVGYGKTEVALRAAHKAVLSGKQVAILVPTTILALQHYQTAISRFRNFAVNVDMLSRFRTPKQIEQSLRRLERGDTDIIIGTHKLLGKDVKFSDLGLLIVDEEQRFGVAQKEKLKQLGNNIDVLTLTATPIPRTLNMAMGGIRDISLLDEAPGDRHPVQTYVLEYDDLIIMEAIRRELRRGGQVFYIHNFVESIDSVAAKISQEIPEARVTVAHGKMDKDYLEDIWSRMISGEIDVLVCTTIIETGIDVPNANTLIADRADRLGLSQLHQLRGRVGRSSRRAYAYFTYPKGRVLSEISQKRLEAIREYAEFGAGFRIALRDMEIRGAGNILGAEQHGHLEAIGYDLYIKLLNDAVLEERGEPRQERGDCIISLNHDALIPEKYVKYPGQRMTLYKRIALIRNQYDADDIADELLDRFGEMPDEVENLLQIALIKARAVDLGIKQITETAGEIRMYQEELNVPMWQEMSFESGGRLRVVIGTVGDSYVSLKLKPRENSLLIVNRMFEKYLETVQTNEKNSDAE